MKNANVRKEGKEGRKESLVSFDGGSERVGRAGHFDSPTVNKKGHLVNVDAGVCNTGSSSVTWTWRRVWI